jgi:thiamine biosynthesis protein ThiI
VALLSGGFDSAGGDLADQKRGVECDLVFCNLGGAAHLREVLRVAEHLATRWSYGSRPRLFAIDFEPVADALRAYTTKRYWQILLKRQMLRAAEAVAHEVGAEAIVTGDAGRPGVVADAAQPRRRCRARRRSRCCARWSASTSPRSPIARVRSAPTRSSESVGEYCALVPNKPATQARLDAVLAEEARLPDDPLRASLAARHVFDLRALDLDASDDAELAVEALPDDAGACSTCARSRNTAPRTIRPRCTSTSRTPSRVAELRPRTPLRRGVRVRAALGPARRSHAARRIPRAPFPRRPARAHARGRARHSGETE